MQAWFSSLWLLLPPSRAPAPASKTRSPAFLNASHWHFFRGGPVRPLTSQLLNSDDETKDEQRHNMAS